MDHSWFKSLKNLKDAARKGWPQKLNDDILKAMMDSNWWIIIEDVPGVQLGIIFDAEEKSTGKKFGFLMNWLKQRSIKGIQSARLFVSAWSRSVFAANFN